MNIKYLAAAVSLLLLLAFPISTSAQIGDQDDMDMEELDFSFSDASIEEGSDNLPFLEEIDDIDDFEDESTPPAGNNPQSIFPTSNTPSPNIPPVKRVYRDDHLYRWYIQGGMGTQLLMAEDDDKSTFMSRFTLAPALTVGYRWNPIFGVRLNLTGGSLHGYNDGHSGTYRFWRGKSEEFIKKFINDNGLQDLARNYGNDIVKRWDPTWNYKGYTMNNGNIVFNHSENALGFHWAPGSENIPGVAQQFYMQHIRYVAAHAALTMNLFNLFGGADDTRKFDMSLHLGPTYFHVFPHLGVRSYDGFGFNGGLQAQYHINERFGIFAEFNGAAMPDGFDGHYGDRSLDLVGQGLLGVTFKIPSTEEVVVTRPAVIDNSMNDELRRLRAELMKEMQGLPDLQPEIDNLRRQLAALTVEEKTEVIEPKKESFFLPDPVHFEINRSNIDAEDLIVIEKVAAYLNNNPTASVIVTGYADKDTGTRAINERLSRERSKAVADVLVHRFYIDQDRISIDWRGDTVQPFYRNQMNRAVLFYIEFND